MGFVERVHSLPSVALSEVQNSQYDEVQVTYGSMENFELLSKQFGLMSDTKVCVCVWMCAYVCACVCTLYVPVSIDVLCAYFVL